MNMAVMCATEQDTIDWFENLHWPVGNLSCLRCGCTEGAYRVKSGKPQPYRCETCNRKRYFSLKTGTAIVSWSLLLRDERDPSGPSQASLLKTAGPTAILRDRRAFPVGSAGDGDDPGGGGVVPVRRQGHDPAVQPRDPDRRRMALN